MKFIYAALLFIIAILMMSGSVVERNRNKTSQGEIIIYLLYFASATILSYAGGMLSGNIALATFFYELFFPMSSWLLIGMLSYCVSHSHLPYFSAYKYIQRALIIAAAAESVSFAVNYYTRHIFYCVKTTDPTGNPLFVPYTFGVFYTLHKIFIVFLAALCGAALIYRAATTPKLYRFRVLSVLVLLTMIMVLNALKYALDLNVDWSLSLYGVLGLVIFYYSILYTPKSLIDRLLTRVALNMDGSLVCFDIDGKCVYANATAKKLFNVENDMDKINEGFKRWLKGHVQSEVEDMSWRESPVIRDKQYHFYTQFKKLFDEHGRYIGNFFLMSDETDEVNKIEEERYRATHDELTGLYNKNYFCEKVEEALKTAKSGEYCMISTDVRDFKLINDMFGKEKGDEVLIAIADTIRRFAKENTIYGRISADRYGIFMPTERFSDRLFTEQAAVLSNCISSSNYQVRIHIGVYEIKNTSIDVSVAVDRANMALRSIKNSFTEVIAHYDDRLRDMRIREQEITADFDNAIKSGQFNIFLQPQIAVGGETIGAEALVRWIHPERGMIPPNEFISVFERTGLIAGMDKYVWELACKQLNIWKNEGRDKYHISVNISPKDFFFTDIYRTFTGLVDKYGISPRNLRLEITETAIMSDVKKQLSLIDRLREFGFAVEMDDFGSGYSSLNMLKDINVDTLKIDMGFLRRTETENKERSIAIINMIISLSKQLGMEVITEGVETREQVDFLTNAGCDIFQGYYFAKPMNVSDFEKKYFN